MNKKIQTELKEWELIYLKLKKMVAEEWLKTKDKKWIEKGKELNENWEIIKKLFN